MHRRRLVALDRYPALAPKVLARLAREVRGLDGAAPFDVLVHPPEEPGRPGAVAFEEGDAEARKSPGAPALAIPEARWHILRRWPHALPLAAPVEPLAGW